MNLINQFLCSSVISNEERGVRGRVDSEAARGAGGKGRAVLFDDLFLNLVTSDAQNRLSAQTMKIYTGLFCRTMDHSWRESFQT